MKCPDCERNSGEVIYGEEFICDKCDGELIINYCVCHTCGYSWRLKNNEFLDGHKIDEETINQMLGSFETFLKEELGTTKSIIREVKNCSKMSDIIHVCIKCGEIAHPIDDCSFECPACGFKWEVLEGGR